jgi:putative photosynthetic complex assembly protein
LRAMARQRKLNGVGAAEPFELILHADGRLTLHDPATGTKIALESFGSRNIGVFAQLLG